MSAQRVPTAAAAAALLMLGAFVASGGCTRKPECSADADCVAGAYCLLPEGYCFWRDGGVTDAGSDAGSGDEDGGGPQGDGGDSDDGGSGPVVQSPLCTSEGWCWVNPQPGWAFLTSVHGHASDGVWAVGSGYILRFDGATWSQSATAPRPALAVVGVGTDLAFAVGFGGLIMKWNGSTWLQDSSPTGATLTSLIAVSRDEIWAAGDEGAIIRFDGSKWRNESTGTNQPIGSLLLQPDGGLEAYAADGTVLRRTPGATWEATGVVGPKLARAVCGFDSGEAWAGSESGMLYRRTKEGVWTEHTPTSQPIGALSCEAPDQVWAGTTGQILRWNGQAWSPDSAAPSFATVTGISLHAGEGWAVGSDGLLMRRKEGSWILSSKHIFGRGNVVDFAPAGDGAVFVLLEGETRIFRCDRSGNCLVSYSAFNSGPVRGIGWRRDSTDVFATQGSGILHWGGSSWSSLDAGIALSSIAPVAAADGGTELWAVEDGAVGRLNLCTQETGGFTCTNVGETSLSKGIDVWSNSHEVAWLRKGSNVVARCGRTECVEQTVGSSALHALSGSGSVVFAAGHGGSLWKNVSDGGWEQVPHFFGPRTFVSVQALDEERVIVGDLNDRILRRSATFGWSEEHPGTVNLRRILALDANDVWVGGYDGRVMHQRRVSDP